MPAVTGTRARPTNRATPAHRRLGCAKTRVNMAMAGRLTGKVALVTGGGGGIGEATARLYHEEGAAVAVVDLNGEAAQAAATGIDPSGERVLAIAADLTDEAEAERAVRETVERFGTLDTLANIAAVRVHGPVTEATVESWQFVIDVNLLAVAYACKFAIPVMAANGGGTIVTISSANATVGRSGMGQYDATKAAVCAVRVREALLDLLARDGTSCEEVFSAPYVD